MHGSAARAARRASRGTGGPVIQAIPQPAGPVAPPPAARWPQNAPAGTVIKNDFLSRLLHRRELPWNMVLVALVIAFALGGAHALTPGHGKTIVAAYLVGSRGTLKHAAFLGAMVTVTHTISVFAFGLGDVIPVPLDRAREDHRDPGRDFGAFDCDDRRLDVEAAGFTERTGTPGIAITGTSHHDHRTIILATSHTHDHHHGPGGHSHVPEGDISWRSLIALAISGGLVPCESALVLLLSAISIGRVGLGLLLLLSFSLGLAGVLMGIGVMVLYAKRLLPERSRIGQGPFMRWAPVASAVVVVVLGIIMTSVSLGWLPSGWQVG